MRRSPALAIGALFTLAITLLGATPAHADSVSAAAAVPHVKVTLAEMTLTLDTTVLPAGPVVFDITNKGAVEHEFVILKTDTAFDAIPPGDEAGKASEDGHIDEVDPVAPGQTVSLSANLTAGNYALVCNKPGHYAAGMRAAFTVSTPLSVSLKEMLVGASQTFARAGTITFNVANSGSITHELVVIKTDKADGTIPVDPSSAGQVDETGSQGEADDVAGGTTATLTLNLPAGKYAFICNKPGHYAAGMHTSFTVLPTLARTTSAAIDRAEGQSGIDPLTDDARVNVAALLKAPGVIVTDLDRAAIAAGIIPRAVLANGSLIY